jgi:hypothetical protein
VYGFPRFVDDAKKVLTWLLTAAAVQSFVLRYWHDIWIYVLPALLVALRWVEAALVASGCRALLGGCAQPTAARGGWRGRRRRGQRSPAGHLAGECRRTLPVCVDSSLRSCSRTAMRRARPSSAG